MSEEEDGAAADLRRRYEAAVDRFEEADKPLDELQGALLAAVKGFGNRLDFDGFRTARPIFDPNAPNLWLRTLPDAETIRAALMRWVDARNELLSAWEALPADRMRGFWLKPPNARLPPK